MSKRGREQLPRAAKRQAQESQPQGEGMVTIMPYLVRGLGLTPWPILQALFHQAPHLFVPALFEATLSKCKKLAKRGGWRLSCHMPRPTFYPRGGPKHPQGLFTMKQVLMERKGKSCGIRIKYTADSESPTFMYCSWFLRGRLRWRRFVINKSEIYKTDPSRVLRNGIQEMEAGKEPTTLLEIATEITADCRVMFALGLARAPCYLARQSTKVNHLS